MKARITRWRDFQHYKFRSPPWIKLYFDMLSSYDWVNLDDKSRILMIVCLLVASRDNGIIDCSEAGAEYILRVAYLSEKPDFAPLFESGFLTGIDIAQASADTEYITEYNTEKETEYIRAERLLVALPCIDGSLFHITEKHAEPWPAAYPALDIPRELAAARAWLLANPTRRKTRRGMLRFVNSWLERAQNRACTSRRGNGSMAGYDEQLKRLEGGDMNV